MTVNVEMKQKYSKLKFSTKDQLYYICFCYNSYNKSKKFKESINTK